MRSRCLLRTVCVEMIQVFRVYRYNLIGPSPKLPGKFSWRDCDSGY